MSMLAYKKFIIGISIISAAIAGRAQATSYYVAASGNDSNSGTSSSSPIKTIDKLNTLVLKPGDVVYFKRGDEFYGSIKIQQSGTANNPICFDAYGSGSTKPVITGSVTVKGWVRSSANNVWQAQCAQATSAIGGVYINDIAQPLGVYPNPGSTGEGYLTIRSHVGSTQLTSQQPLRANFTGGQIVIRKNLWDIDVAAITAQQGNTLKFNSDGSAIQDKWGYFIQNHPATLDRQGEWCYDAGTKTIKLYSTTDPNNAQVSAAVISSGITASGRSNIVIQNIAISQVQNSAINAKKMRNLRISNASISYCGRYGISVQGNGDNVVIEDCDINNIYDSAVMVTDHSNFTMRDNSIKNTGLVPGRGNNYSAVRYTAKSGSALIEDNTIENTGYIGIDFRSKDVTVQRNVVKNFNLIKSDGGGIYTFSGGAANNYVNQRIINNIVLNGVGSYAGTYNANQNSHGIYMDACSHDVEISNNTIADCTAAGIFLNGTRNIVVKNNNCYNNATEVRVGKGKCDNTGNVVSSNVFVRKNRALVSRVAKLVAGDVDNTNKVFDSADSDKVRFEYNASKLPKDITLNGIYRDAKNKIYQGKVTLAPFTSLILTK